MAAHATSTTTGRQSRRVRKKNFVVEQPPRTILVGGKRVDVSHLTGDDLFEAALKDEEQWDYERLAAEADRAKSRVTVWVSNAYTAEREKCVPDDKTFVVPDGKIGGSPWWYAGNARRVLHQMGVMNRAFVAQPYKPTGRAPGAKDVAPRKRWEHAPMRDTAADIYREYRELTNREKAWLSDREARAELCTRHNLNRSQLARRIKAGKELVDAEEGAAGKPAEVDAAALRGRLDELIAEQRAAGYSERGASERARTALAEETGLTRRQIAGYVAAAKAAAGDGEAA